MEKSRTSKGGEGGGEGGENEQERVQSLGI